MDRITPRDPFRRAGWYGFALIALLLVVVPAACHFSVARAGPVFQASGTDGFAIVLFDEPCALEVVTNLRYRALWRQNAELFEGCWAPSPFGVIMFYFADRTMAVVPTRLFVKVGGA